MVGVRIRGTLGEIDPLNKVPFKRATSRSPLRGLLRLPRTGLVRVAQIFKSPAIP